jgi:hypothetical protein
MDTWQKVHQMSEAELAEYAQRHLVDVSGEFLNLAAAADFVCAELQIPRPASHEGEELDRLAQVYMAEHHCTYVTALDAVRRAHPQVAKCYVESFGMNKSASRD